LERPDGLVITFDDEQTSVDVIVQKLKQGGNPVEGAPVFLK
jgi:hypothetical protein